MKNIGERVKQIRKSQDLTLEKFGERIGVTKSSMSNIERGERNVTPQMFKSICREFNVNPTYLQDGTGEMFIELNQDSVIAGWVGRVLRDKPESFRKNAIAVMSTWTDEDWDWIEKQARAIIEGVKKSHE